MGKVDKGVGCVVTGCKYLAAGARRRAEIGDSGLNLGGDGRRAYLCKEHYKAWKKATKKSRTLERSRW